MVFIEDTTNIAGADRKAAAVYRYETEGANLGDVCKRNSEIARSLGRVDHERALRDMSAVFSYCGRRHGEDCSLDWVGMNVVLGLYSDFAKTKDLQMLAMLSSLLLQFCDSSCLRKESVSSSLTQPADYFSLKKDNIDHSAPTASWPRRPSTNSMTTQIDVSSPNSSRGSWSSLFGTSTVRQFMSNVQETLKDGLSTPDGLHLPGFEIAIAQNKTERPKSGSPELSLPTLAVESSSGNRKRLQQRKLSDSNSQSATPRPWNEALVLPHPLKPSLSISVLSAGQGSKSSPMKSVPDLNHLGRRKNRGGKRVVTFTPPTAPTKPRVLFDFEKIQQFSVHVYAYAELLFRWQMYHKRSELLKSIKHAAVTSDDLENHTIGLSHTCIQCNMILPYNSVVCPSCNVPYRTAKCSVCRLPVKGLSRSCFHCLHVTHIRCWNDLGVPICPTGCGCLCSGLEET